MPNPKLGTVTPTSPRRCKAAKGGQVEYRAEKAGLVQAGVGKASFTEEAIVENVRTFVGAISRAKPTGVKGTFIKKVSLSSTMGPGLKLEIIEHRPVRGGRSEIGVPAGNGRAAYGRMALSGACSQSCPRLQVPAFGPA